MTTSLFNNEFLSDCKLHIHNDDLETTIHGHLSILINKNQYFSKLIDFHKGKDLKDLIFDIDLSSGGSVESALDIIRYIYGEIELVDEFVKDNRTIVDFFALDLIKIRPIAVDISDVTRPTKFSIENVITSITNKDGTIDEYESGFALVIPSKNQKYSLFFVIDRWKFFLFVDSKFEHEAEIEAYYFNYIKKSIKYDKFYEYKIEYDGDRYKDMHYLAYNKDSSEYDNYFTFTSGMVFTTKPQEVINFLVKDLLIDSNILNIIQDINNKYDLGFSFQNKSNKLKEYTKYHDSELLNAVY